MKRMKEGMLLLMTAVCLVQGAGSAFAATAAANKTENAASEKTAYSFTYENHQYQVGMEAKPAMEVLGEAKSSRDVNNCANGYINKAYMYGDKDFEIYVEQSGGKEIVANITLFTSKVSTEEGLKPGDGAARVTEIYKDAKKGLGSYSTTLGSTKLFIKMKDDKVSYISYLMEK